MTLDEILTTLTASGWLVNNLFQLADGSWQANLRNDSSATPFGFGPTPAEALGAAFDDLRQTYPLIEPPSTFAIDTSPIPSLLSLIPRRPVYRRF